MGRSVAEPFLKIDVDKIDLKFKIFKRLEVFNTLKLKENFRREQVIKLIVEERFQESKNN